MYVPSPSRQCPVATILVCHETFQYELGVLVVHAVPQREDRPALEGLHDSLDRLEVRLDVPVREVDAVRTDRRPPPPGKLFALS